jgi:uncharacterized membrane protein YphA (DoxX/SURF4 family)
MFTAGMSKLFHGNFPDIIGPVWLTDELGKYGLEYLGLFIAWSQTIIGLLLLTQRFATLGAIMVMPMLLNIFMVMFSMGLHYSNPHEVNSMINTSIIVGVLILLNIALLLHDFHKLKFIFDESDEFLKTRKVRRKNHAADYLVIVGMLLCLLSPFIYSVNKIVAYAIVIIGLIICLLPVLMKKKMSSAINS